MLEVDLTVREHRNRVPAPPLCLCLLCLWTSRWEASCFAERVIKKKKKYTKVLLSCLTPNATIGGTNNRPYNRMSSVVVRSTV